MEDVMVVPKQMLEKTLKVNSPKLFIKEKEEISKIVLENYKFYPREKAEYDVRYKQIIPYAFLTYKDSIFVLKRLSKQNEARLHNKVSVGVGGHINPLKVSSNIIEEGLLKELNEEINMASTEIKSLDLIGVINDDITEVGKFHLGYVYHIELTNRNIHILETEKMDGEWVQFANLHTYLENMESWSKIILNRLLQINA